MWPNLLYCRSMAMTLSPEVERLVEARLQRGDFSSADDFIRAALAALDEQELYALDEETLDAIDEAERQIDAGQVHAWEDVRDEIRARFTGK